MVKSLSPSSSAQMIPTLQSSSPS